MNNIIDNINNYYQATDWIIRCIPLLEQITGQREMDIPRDKIYFQRSFMVNRKAEEINLTIELKNRKRKMIILEIE